MDLNFYATKIAQTDSKTALSGSQTSAIMGGNGLGGLGANFWEIILGNITADGTLQTEANNNKTDGGILTNDGVKKEVADLSLLQLALMGQDIQNPLDEKLAQLKLEKLAQNQENRIAQLTKLINHLTSGLPQQADTEAASISELVARLNQRLESLTASLEAFRSGDFNTEDAPFKLLIATGLNPAQLTRITNRIEEIEAKLGRQLTVEDLIAGVGNIIPAPGEKDDKLSASDALSMLIETPELNLSQEIHEDKILDQDLLADIHNAEFINNQVIANTAVSAQVSAKTSPTIFYHKNDIQAMLNAIASSRIAPAGTPTNGLAPVNTDTTTMPEKMMEGLSQPLSNAEFKALFASAPKNTAAMANIAAQMTLANKAGAQATPIISGTTAGALTLPTSWDSTFSALSDSLGYDIHTGSPYSHTMQATSTANFAPSSSQLHPATQMVAVQMTKAAQNSSEKAITLQLDPPELGRVEVRMEFGKDNKVKAHMIVEKPETLLMLQRDSGALERALQDAGMDTGSDSLDYQMAQENYGFGQDNKGQNGQTGTENANHNSGDSEEEIIVTTVNWNIDPETGHVRYNIIA